MLFPPQLDEYIPQNHLARVVDLFVESLDMAALGIRENNQETGRASYDLKVMMKLSLYGYSQGGRSSRRLERLTYKNTAHMWLTGNLHPDYRRIARFRQQNLSVTREILKKTLELYRTVDGELAEVVFADGTKVFANVSDDATVTEEKIKRLEGVANRILKEEKDCAACSLQSGCYQKKVRSYGRQVMVLDDREFLECYEDVIGVIKSCLGFRRFLLKWLAKVRGAWNLMVVAYNLIKFPGCVSRLLAYA